MLPNGPALVAALFGVWQAGGVYTPLNPRSTDTETARVIEAAEPAAVITTAEHRHRFPGLPVLTIGDKGEAPDPLTTPPPAGRGYESDIALIQLTSGTTGRPKPVLLRHSGVLTLIDGVVGKLRVASSDRPAMPNLIPVSLSLWSGLYQIIFAFRVGAAVIVMERFTTGDFRDLVQRFQIRSTVLPPAAMTMLSDDASITDLAPLRYVRSISSPLSPLQARRFKERFGVMVLNCYGQTEIGGEVVGWSAADSRQFGDDKLGAAGRPHAGVTVRTGEAGELLLKTPALSAGYASGLDFGDRLTPDGWFRTGDVGRVDDDGFVWIEGRLSDMINRGGLKVFPEEVAEVLRLSPDVADAAVVGVADERLGEVPWAFVVPVTSATLSDEGLTALCRQHLAPYKVPARFVTVAELPRNEAGKVLSSLLVKE
jgi:acyl-CoA synthetase (AMP-forming)/AMP-acid ligase II